MEITSLKTEGFHYGQNGGNVRFFYNLPCCLPTYEFQSIDNKTLYFLAWHMHCHTIETRDEAVGPVEAMIRVGTRKGRMR